MRTPSVALDDDFATVTGSYTKRLTAAFLAFLAADVASAIATLFWSDEAVTSRWHRWG